MDGTFFVYVWVLSYALGQAADGMIFCAIGLMDGGIKHAVFVQACCKHVIACGYVRNIF